MAFDGQIAPLPSPDVVKVEPHVNVGLDASQDPITPKTSNTDGLSPVLAEEHTAVNNDTRKLLRTQNEKYQAEFALVN